MVSGWRARGGKPLLEHGQQERGGNHTQLWLQTHSWEPRKKQTQSSLHSQTSQQAPVKPRCLWARLLTRFFLTLATNAAGIDDADSPNLPLRLGVSGSFAVAMPASQGKWGRAGACPARTPNSSSRAGASLTPCLSHLQGVQVSARASRSPQNTPGFASPGHPVPQGWEVVRCSELKTKPRVSHSRLLETSPFLFLKEKHGWA